MAMVVNISYLDMVWRSSGHHLFAFILLMAQTRMANISVLKIAVSHKDRKFLYIKVISNHLRHANEVLEEPIRHPIKRNLYKPKYYTVVLICPVKQFNVL